MTIEEQAKARAYYLANREKILARMKAFREANPDKEAHRRAVAAAYQARSKDITAARGKKHREANKESISARVALWASANKERRQKTNAAWYVENRERKQVSDAAWSAANPDKVRATYAKYKAANLERVRANGEAYRARNMPKFAAKESKRRATKKGATPAWLTPAQHSEMLRIYTFAAAIGCHVDHIVPLQGKTVCGLHVPWNLAVLTPEENHIKINRLLPEHVYRAPPIPPPAHGGRRSGGATLEVKAAALALLDYPGT